MQFQILPHDDYFLVHLEGLVSVPAWDQVLQELAAALAGERGDRLVVNLSGLVGWLGMPERKDVGALWAAQLGAMSKVALVIEQSKITGVVEDEAQRNGLNLRLFAGYDDAVRWVHS